MTTVATRFIRQRRRPARRAGQGPVFVRVAALVLVALSAFQGTAEAQPPACPVIPLNPPPPIPVPLVGQNVVQFVNESCATLLLAAVGPTGFGCDAPSTPGTPACPGGTAAGSVLPREGTWVLAPGARLTVDIPLEWQNTAPTSAGNPAGGRLGSGPRFWARTGCRYDEASNIAQCETGDWGGMYDAFRGPATGQRKPYGPTNGGVPAGISPNTFTEWCFNCSPYPPTSGAYTHNHWDVSVVDGGDLSVNIEPLPPFSPKDPDAPGSVFWCQTKNAVPGSDLRANCPADFQLKRSQLSSYIVGSEDRVVACFSNCGKTKYPTAPICTGATPDSRCPATMQYCCLAFSEYEKTCTEDSQCSFGSACYQGMCTCRGFLVNPPCPDTVCTNQGLGVPPYGTCSGDPGPLQCIGDDTMHAVLPRAYSWPNDPQTYDCDARAFRVTFAPGGTAVTTTSAGPVAQCAALPAAYGYNDTTCAGSRSQGLLFAGAVLATNPNPDWQCGVTSTTSGVLCQFSSPIAVGQLRSGTATGVGVAPAADGGGRGALKVSGVFAFDARLNLAAPGAKVTIINGLDGGPNGGELAPGSHLTLAADGRNTATTARFKTARGQTPTAEVTIGSRSRGQFNFRLGVSRGTVDVPPACPQPELTTSIKIDDGTNPPLVVVVTQPWECLKRGAKIQYLRAP